MFYSTVGNYSISNTMKNTLIGSGKYTSGRTKLYILLSFPNGHQARVLSGRIWKNVRSCDAVIIIDPPLIMFEFFFISYLAISATPHAVNFTKPDINEKETKRRHRPRKDVTFSIRGSSHKRDMMVFVNGSVLILR